MEKTLGDFQHGKLSSDPKEEIFQETAGQGDSQKAGEDQKGPHRHPQSKEKRKKASGGFQECQHEVTDRKGGEDEFSVFQEERVGQRATQDAEDDQIILLPPPARC